MEDVIREAFHRPVTLRPFGQQHGFLVAQRTLLKCIWPPDMWRSIVVDFPLRTRLLATFWCTCSVLTLLTTYLLIAFLDLSPRLPMERSLAFSVLVPILCCSCVLAFRNSRVRGHVPASSIVLCYALSMPVFVIVWGLMMSFLAATRSGAVALCVVVVATALWTAGVAFGFRSHLPARKMMGVMIVTHVIAPFGALIIVFALTIAGWNSYADPLH